MFKQRGWTLTELLAVLAVLAGLAIVGVTIWVIAHFVIKFW